MAGHLMKVALLSGLSLLPIAHSAKGDCQDWLTAETAAAMSCNRDAGEVLAHVRGDVDKSYGASRPQCAQLCLPAALLPSIEDAGEGTCAGYTRFQLEVGETTVQNATLGLPNPVPVKLYEREPACYNEDDVVARAVGDLAVYYGATRSDQCAQICVPLTTLLFMPGVEQGDCFAAGAETAVEARKSVQPPGSLVAFSVDVHVGCTEPSGPAPTAVGMVSEPGDGITRVQGLPLLQPEAMEYEPLSDTYLITNGQQYISRLSPEGTMLDQYFMVPAQGGPNAMHAANGKVYVAGTGAVNVFNATTGTELEALTAGGALSGDMPLNGLCFDGPSNTVITTNIGIDMTLLQPNGEQLIVGMDATTGDPRVRFFPDGAITKYDMLPNGCAVHEAARAMFVCQSPMFDGDLFLCPLPGFTASSARSEGLCYEVPMPPTVHRLGLCDGVVFDKDGHLYMSAWTYTSAAVLRIRAEEIAKVVAQPGYEPAVQMLYSDHPTAGVTGLMWAPADMGYDPARHALLVPGLFGPGMEYYVVSLDEAIFGAVTEEAANGNNFQMPGIPMTGVPGLGSDWSMPGMGMGGMMPGVPAFGQRPDPAEGLRDMYHTQEEAEVAARIFGCDGAHQMGDKWMPGATHGACDHLMGGEDAPAHDMSGGHEEHESPASAGDDDDDDDFPYGRTPNTGSDNDSDSDSDSDLFSSLASRKNWERRDTGGASSLSTWRLQELLLLAAAALLLALP